MDQYRITSHNSRTLLCEVLRHEPIQAVVIVIIKVHRSVTELLIPGGTGSATLTNCTDSPLTLTGCVATSSAASESASFSSSTVGVLVVVGSGSDEFMATL